MTTTDQNVLFDGYSIHELAASLLGSARRHLMSDENEETYSANRALDFVRREFYVKGQRLDLAKDEAQRLVEKLAKSGLGSLEVCIAAEAIMTERSR